MALGRSKVLLITRLKDMANQGQPSDQADRNVQDDTHVMIGPSLSIVRRQPWMWKFSCACLCLCSVTVFALVPVVVFALSLSIYCLTYRETSLDMEVWLGFSDGLLPTNIPEAQKPGWQGGIAIRKDFARPESFCA